MTGMQDPGPRTAIAVLIFELVAMALLFWLAIGLASCSISASDSTRHGDVYGEAP